MEEKEKDFENEFDPEEEIANAGDSWWTITFDTETPTKWDMAHFAVCLSIVIATYLLLGINNFGNVAIGFGLAMLCGCLKELFDKYVKKAEWCWRDIAFDIFGSFAGIFVCSIIYIITH